MSIWLGVKVLLDFRKFIRKSTAKVRWLCMVNMPVREGTHGPVNIAIVQTMRLYRSIRFKTGDLVERNPLGGSSIDAHRTNPFEVSGTCVRQSARWMHSYRWKWVGAIVSAPFHHWQTMFGPHGPSSGNGLDPVGLRSLTQTRTKGR